jgi:hypothetical protein
MIIRSNDVLYINKNENCISKNTGVNANIFLCSTSLQHKLLPNFAKLNIPIKPMKYNAQYYSRHKVDNKAVYVKKHTN